jgi:hypothetical protein
MTWFRVDDNFYQHPKWLGATAEQIALWCVAGSWAAHWLTDGEVSLAALETFPLGDARAVAEQLVERGLWEHWNGSYRFHDWRDYQPTRKRVLAERARSVERVKRWRYAHANDGANGDVNGDVTAVTPPFLPSDQGVPVSNAVNNAVVTPPPGPARPLKGGPGRAAPTPAGARARPDDDAQPQWDAPPGPAQPSRAEPGGAHRSAQSRLNSARPVRDVLAEQTGDRKPATAEAREHYAQLARDALAKRDSDQSETRALDDTLPQPPDEPKW